MRQLFTYGASFLALMIAAPAIAAESQPDPKAGGNRVVVLSDWAYEPLYESGWSVEQMMDDAAVVGPSGEEIGQVENLVISDGGQIMAMIAEVGGVLDMGDTHVSIPWDEVKVSKDMQRIEIPINEQSADDYLIFGDRSPLLKEEADRIVTVDEEGQTGTKIFKATDLIGDYAYLNEDVQYGYVNDLLVQKGKVSAVVIDASRYARPGYYAFPYRADGGWRPSSLRYQLPYVEGEIATIDTFDYDLMKRGANQETERSSLESTDTGGDGDASKSATN
jgi:sporulation protein YlmC with PRC-barrel domain